jgi:multimeric flavodoxin WrbA
MTICVFHGSPRQGNTHRATTIFLDELTKQGDLRITEFFLPDALPVFCTGCTLCLAGQREKCPNARYVSPILDALLQADALLFATPHYGSCDMPASMKTLLDHLDFLVLNIAPREEIFRKKAFILTTAAGTTAAIRPIAAFLKHWGINHVDSLGLRLFTDRWGKMPPSKQANFEKKLRRSARKFYRTPRRRPHLATFFFFYMSRFVLKRFVGAGNAPYELWKEKGYFKKRPF